MAIYNGEDRTSPLIGRFCGSTPPVMFTSQSNLLHVEWHTNNDNNTDRGFLLQYETISQGANAVFTYHSFKETALCSHVLSPLKAVVVSCIVRTEQ